MILGLCSSFAVVPAAVAFSSAGGPARRPVAPARPSGDAMFDPGGSAGLAALLVTDAALSAARLEATVATSGTAVNAQTPTAAVTASPAPAAPTPAPVAAPPPAAPALRPAAVVPTVSGEGSQGGEASWLNTIPSGTCANNAAPMGSVITVTSAGISVTCRVVSRGPFVAGRVVDLAMATFATLGPVSRGLVPVSVSW